MRAGNGLRAVFVHGMGRSPLSGYLLLRTLRREGVETLTFGYAAALSDFEVIVRRLARKIDRVSRAGDYVVIGHSLGGVMIRAALASRPPSRLPAHVFLLGSPIHSARLARSLRTNGLYRFLAGDCGQLLGSHERMASVGALCVPTTAIVGTRGWPTSSRIFAGEQNDGVIAVSEASAHWITDRVSMPIVHSLLPASRRVARVILDRITT